MPILACGVQYRRNSHHPLAFVDFIDHAVGKPLWVSPMDVLDRMQPTTEQRISCQRVPHLNDVLDKPSPKSGFADFISFGSLGNIALHFRSELDAPIHL